MNRSVAYYRVSTSHQGTSGLGLEAQRDYVNRWCARGNAEILKEFKEVESGGNDHRPILKEAIQYAKDNDAVLLVAKLDRLARSVSLLASLQEEKDFRFVCCDMPEANELTLHIMMAMAQHERKLASRRTKEALAAKRRKDPNWRAGTNNLTITGRAKGGEVLRKRYRECGEWKRALAVIGNLASQGITRSEAAEWYKDNEYKTPAGNEPTVNFVKNLAKAAGVKFKSGKRRA